MSKISSIVIAAFLAVSSSAFATSDAGNPGYGDGERGNPGNSHNGKADPHPTKGNDYSHNTNPGNGGHDNGNHYGHDKDKPNNGGGSGGSGGNGGNGGQGGSGGAGGSGGVGTGIGTGISSSNLNANLSSKSDASASAASISSARSGDSISGAVAGGGTSSAGASASGNGGAATVGVTDNSTVKYVTNVLPEAPSAPLSMAIGNIATSKMGVCGPMFDIQENAAAVIQTTPGVIFGLGADYATVRTMHGMLRGLSNTDFIYQNTIEPDGNGDSIKVVRMWGHQLVMVATVTGTSAGSGVGVSGSNGAGAGSVGITNGAGAALPGVLVTAMPCVYKMYTVKPAPVVVPPAVNHPDSKGKSVKTTLAPIPAN